MTFSAYPVGGRTNDSVHCQAVRISTGWRYAINVGVCFGVMVSLSSARMFGNGHRYSRPCRCPAVWQLLLSLMRQRSIQHSPLAKNVPNRTSRLSYGQIEQARWSLTLG